MRTKFSEEIGILSRTKRGTFTDNFRFIIWPELVKEYPKEIWKMYEEMFESKQLISILGLAFLTSISGKEPLFPCPFVVCSSQGGERLAFCGSEKLAEGFTEKEKVVRRIEELSLPILQQLIRQERRKAPLESRRFEVISLADELGVEVTFPNEDISEE